MDADGAAANQEMLIPATRHHTITVIHAPIQTFYILGHPCHARQADSRGKYRPSRTGRSGSSLRNSPA